MEDWLSALASWSGFILLHVLPIAVSQIVDWLREWQILVAAFLLLIFFHFWSRAILSAARQAAKETVVAETRAFDASLKLLRRQLESGVETPRAPPKPTQPVATAPAVATVLPTPPEATGPEPRGQAAIERLRQAIRLALSTIPTSSDEPLAPGSLRLYRAAIDALDPTDTDLGTKGRQDVLNQIQAELAALRHSFPPQSCRLAWQSLVRVNALAREFREPAPLTRAEALAGQRGTS